MDINIRVSPSLHPGNITAIEGYDDETADSVADVLQAFTTAYEGVSAVAEARAAATQNPALNDAARVLVVADFADKHFTKIAAKFDTAAARLKRSIADGQRTLSQPMEGAATGGFTAEIRAYVHGLDRANRASFMSKAVHDGDQKTLAAVLGAPHYLSGLSVAERDLYSRQYQERTNPALAKRLLVMKAAEALLGERSGLIFSDLEKAVGASGAHVANLRAAQEKATKAYTFTA